MTHLSSLPTPGSPRKAQDLKYLHSPFTAILVILASLFTYYKSILEFSYPINFGKNLKANWYLCTLGKHSTFLKMRNKRLDQIKEEIEIIKIDNEKKNVDDDKDY